MTYLKIIFLRLACYATRNLRCSERDSRIFRFLVIRSRTLLKKFIHRNLDCIHSLGRVQIRLKYAGRMELLPNDYVDRWLFTGADYEPHITRLLLKYLNKGDWVLDIGANIGYHTLVAANLVGSSGKIDAFEPSPRITERLKKNVQLNPYANISVHEKAVSNHNGEVTLKMPSDFIGNSGRSSFRDLEENYTGCNVQTVRLDDYLHLTKRIKLIKMDIEGAEALALDGMKMIIKNMQPIVLMELSQTYLTQLGASARQILDFFRERGYKIYIAGEQVVPLLPDDPVPEQQLDILCLPEYNKLVN